MIRPMNWPVSFRIVKNIRPFSLPVRSLTATKRPRSWSVISDASGPISLCSVDGDKPIRKKIELLNQKAELVKRNETAVEYLTHYNKWQTMAGEVFQIIQNAMAEGMSILD